MFYAESNYWFFNLNFLVCFFLIVMIIVVVIVVAIVIVINIIMILRIIMIIMIMIIQNNLRSSMICCLFSDGI